MGCAGNCSWSEVSHEESQKEPGVPIHAAKLSYTTIRLHVIHIKSMNRQTDMPPLEQTILPPLNPPNNPKRIMSTTYQRAQEPA
jgi:hypothetical protein